MGLRRLKKQKDGICIKKEAIELPQTALHAAGPFYSSADHVNEEEK
jgi:hypothetical protein